MKIPWKSQETHENPIFVTVISGSPILPASRDAQGVPAAKAAVSLKSTASRRAQRRWATLKPMGIRGVTLW